MVIFKNLVGQLGSMLDLARLKNRTNSIEEI
jgi:hypothetical protein